MLPGRDGLEILQTLRKRGLQTPVLILAARVAVEDRALSSEAMDPPRVAELRALRHRLGPFELARTIDGMLERICALGDRHLSPGPSTLSSRAVTFLMA